MDSGFTAGIGEFSFFHIERDFELRAPLESVFAALINDISPWWGAPYLLDAAARGMTLEPWPGGRLYESWSESARVAKVEGAIWARVAEIADDELITLIGPLGLDWPTNCELRLRLSRLDGAEADGTRLNLRHRALGRISTDQHENFEHGWGDLLGKRLRAWVERGERLGIGHEPLPWADLPGAPNQPV
jgi:uncharacterized protein YndB with AHSA1/START domain